MTRTCPECGATVADDATFCLQCGEMLPAPPSSSPAPAPTPVPAPTTAAPPTRRTTQGSPAGPTTGTTGRRPRVIVVRQRPTRQPLPRQPAPWPQQWPTWPPQGQAQGQGPAGGSPGPQGGRVVVRRRGCCLSRLFLLLILVPLAYLALSSLFGGLLGDTTTTTTPAPAPRSSGIPSTSPSASDAASSGARPVLSGRECSRASLGPYAGAAAGNAETSCAFAVATRAAYLQAGATGAAQELVVPSAARGGNVRLSCSDGPVVTCDSGDGAVVHLYDGEVQFR